MKTANNILIGFLLAVFLFIGLLAGYKLYPSIKPCPVSSKDTIFIRDTIYHFIPDTVPWLVIERDTVIYHDTVFKDVDTAEILKNYYASYFYTRNWNDSIVDITLKDEISENSFIKSDIGYKLLKPQTVVTNVTNNYNYSRYLTVGASLPTKSIEHMNMNLSARYVMPRWYIEVGYDAELNCPTFGAGATILKMK